MIGSLKIDAWRDFKTGFTCLIMYTMLYNAAERDNIMKITPAPRDILPIDMNKKFELGTTVVTVTIDNAIKLSSAFGRFIKTCLGRYANADWGDTCAEDRKTNDKALINGERILAVYIYPKSKAKIWIITERDRSATTVLLPSDY